MVDPVTIGELTCPSGELVIIDGGCLGLWVEHVAGGGGEFELPVATVGGLPRDRHLLVRAGWELTDFAGALGHAGQEFD